MAGEAGIVDNRDGVDVVLAARCWNMEGEVVNGIGKAPLLTITWGSLHGFSLGEFRRHFRDVPHPPYWLQISQFRLAGCSWSAISRISVNSVDPDPKSIARTPTPVDPFSSQATITLQNSNSDETTLLGGITSEAKSQNFVCYRGIDKAKTLGGVRGTVHTCSLCMLC